MEVVRRSGRGGRELRPRICSRLGWVRKGGEREEEKVLSEGEERSGFPFFLVSGCVNVRSCLNR